MTRLIHWSLQIIRLRTLATGALAALAALALLGACDRDSGVTQPESPEPPQLPKTALVSEPLALQTVAASGQLRLKPTAAALLQSPGQAAAGGSAERLVYVSLPSGAYPAGVTASIRNTAGGPSLTQTMVEGGFDPIAIPAGVGDTIVIDIRNGAGATTTSVLLAVPRRRPPIVVRTYPPKGKRDVVLNSRVIIAFSEPIAPSTLTPSSVALFRADTPVPGVVRLFPGGVVAEFVPSAPLQRRTTYRLGVTRDITDLDGDALSSAVSVDFTTGDTSSAAITSVQVTPPSATLEMGDVLGDSVQLVATVRSAQGVVTDREVIWSTDNPAVAVVSSTGLVTPFAEGLATITATSEGQTGAAQITVVPIPVVRVDITPLNPRVKEGEITGLFALPKDRNNQALTRRAMAWQSSDASVATVDQRGLVTGVAAGTATITVTSEGVSGSRIVTVGEPLLNRVEIDPPAAAVTPGGSVQLSARAYRCDAAIASCQEVIGQPITWASADPAAATVDQSGRVTAASTGLVAISATVDGLRGEAMITVLPTVSLNFATIFAGYYFTCGLTPAGEAFCWGQNFFGQLGIGQATPGPEHAPAAVAPLPVTGGFTFASISVGGWHVCGLTNAGAAYCWGLANFNQLGQIGPFGTHRCGGLPCTPAPVAVPGGVSFRALYAGGLHTCALTASGTAYCWGVDRYGQVGDAGGVTSHGLPPTPVAGGHTFASLSAGWRHVCGVTTGGRAYCWGYNYHGQLGDGSNFNRDGPVAVAGGHTFASVSAFALHTCGVTTSGDAYCWGDNYYGELGDGTHASSNAPVAVSGGLTFASVSASGGSTCGLTTSGAAYCWGITLGDRSGSNRPVPVAVAGGLTFSAITTGESFACGLGTGQIAYCWGGNGSGQLGDGSATIRRTPARVAGQP